jgi:hypothetical protein
VRPGSVDERQRPRLDRQVRLSAPSSPPTGPQPWTAASNPGNTTRDGACAGPVGRHKSEMPRHKLLNYIGTIVAATVPIKVSNTINHDGRLLTYIGNRQILSWPGEGCDVWTYLATDVAKSGLRCEGLPVSAASKARSAGIAALLSPARAPKLQPRSEQRRVKVSGPTLRTPGRTGSLSPPSTGTDRGGGHRGVWAPCGGNGWGECGEATGIFGFEGRS